MSKTVYWVASICACGKSKCKEPNVTFYLDPVEFNRDSHNHGYIEVYDTGFLEVEVGDTIYWTAGIHGCNCGTATCGVKPVLMKVKDHPVYYCSDSDEEDGSIVYNCGGSFDVPFDD